MDFKNLWVTLAGEPEKREGIPDQYQEFLPEFITKDKMSYPYSYDPFLIYWNEESKGMECKNSIYTDRL